MTNRVYHVPARNEKVTFDITDNIFQLNDDLMAHLDKLRAMIGVADTNEKLVECQQSILHHYFLLMEDEVDRLYHIQKKFSAYLQLVR